MKSEWVTTITRINGEWNIDGDCCDPEWSTDKQEILRILDLAMDQAEFNDKHRSGYAS